MTMATNHLQVKRYLQAGESCPAKDFVQTCGDGETSSVGGGQADQEGRIFR